MLWIIKNRSLLKLNKEIIDYILTKNGKPVEEDVIYAAESVIELINDGFKLEDGEKFELYEISD